MRHRDFVAAIARRLPHQTQRDVGEVIEVMVELMQDELSRNGAVALPGIGKLSIKKRMVAARWQYRGSFRMAPALIKQLHDRRPR